MEAVKYQRRERTVLPATPRGQLFLRPITAPLPSVCAHLQHDDGITPPIVDAVNKTIGSRKNPNGCTIPLTWCVGTG